MHSSFLLTVCFTALAATANPMVVRQSPITLPFAKVINATGTTNIVKSDQARIKALKDSALVNLTEGIPPVRVSATHQLIYYLTSVGIGTPSTYYNLIVDTGSSITWAGANSTKPYVITSSSVDTGFGATLLYGSGFATGEEYNDTVAIGPIAIHSQGIVAANSSTVTGFTGEDGVLGLGPVDLTVGVTTSNEDIPTVVDNAFAQGLIPARSIAVSFGPTDTVPVTNGEVTFGGIDPTKFISQITYTPITTTSPASRYWGINQSVDYKGKTILTETAGIVDTGTTLVYLASDAFSLYQNATGATLDSSVGMLYIAPDQYDQLVDLEFNIGGSQFTLTPNAQIWPRALNSAQGFPSNRIYLVIDDLGTPTGEGFDFVNGQAFLERFYSVFDSVHNRVGFAETVLTRSVIN